MANKSPGTEEDENRRTKHHHIIASVIKYWPAQLFIFVEKSKIYAYKRLPLLLKTFSSRNAEEIKKSLIGENEEIKKRLIEENEESEKILIEEYLESKKYRPINKTEISKIKKDLLLYINKNKEKKVKICGQMLNKLIYENIETAVKEELQKDDDKNNKILIYCKDEDEDIDYVWEWIYWKEKNFFWGDKFTIVRIQEGCDMSDCRVHNEVNILADDSTGDLSNYAEDLKKGLNKAGVSECRVIPPSDSDTELDISSDCIIYATGVDANKMYKDKLDDFFLDRKKVLFWNLYPSRPLRLEELPDTWLDTRFEDLDIPKEFTLSFVKLFFDVLKELLEEVNGANEERKVTVAEILRKTRERLISNQKGSQFNNLWRLAYIVNGNPCTRLTVRH